MAFRYSRSAMTGAAIFTLAGVTVLPLAQANAAPVSPQDEARSGATQGQPNSAAQNGQDQGQQQGANANGQGQGASSASQSGQGQQQGQPSASQDQQGANAGGQGQQAQGAPASQSSSNSNSASQNNQSRQSQPSAPAKQSSGYATITSVDGFIDPQKTNNSLSVGITGVDNTHRIISDLRVQELDEFGNIVNDDVSTGGASSINSDGDFGISAIVDGTKINPNHHYRVYIDAFDRDTLTASYAYYPVVVWNRTYIPVVPLSAAR